MIQKQYATTRYHTMFLLKPDYKLLHPLKQKTNNTIQVNLGTVTF